MQRIGLLGLGIIGQAWAQRYAATGCLGGVWNRSPKPDAPGWQDSPEAVVRACSAVQIVVADPPAVQQILDRILPELKPGKTLIQSSTIDPESSERFEAQVRATGAAYVEAPFTGGAKAGLEGKTVFFMGGRPEEIDAIEPILEALSETRFRAGTGRQAASIKLAMNLNLAIQMAGFAESLTFARRAGISDDLYFQILSRNMGHSPLIDLKEEKFRKADFSPQFSVKHMAKDTRLATAASAGAHFPLLGAARQCLEAAEAKGMGDEDYSSILRLL